MEKFLKTCAALLCIVPLWLMSCQKDEKIDTVSLSMDTGSMSENYEANLVDNTIKEQYEVRNGILHFKDVDAYTNALNALKNKSVEEQMNFGKEGRFVSLLTHFDKMNKDLASASSKEQYNQVLKSSQDIVRVDNDIPKLRIANSSLAPILDRNGIVYIGKIIYKYRDDKQVCVFDGDINKADVTSNQSNGAVIPFRVKDCVFVCC